MDRKEELQTLKSQVYDLLVLIEGYKLKLTQINQKIKELSSTEKPEGDKE